MAAQSVVNYEQVLVDIVRALSPNQAEQLVDFARFLAAQRDTLLATDESQGSVEKMTKEAQTEYRVGRDTDKMDKVKIVFWQDDGAWLGYLQDYPDYWTQGETLDELRAFLKDLYSDIVSGTIPGMRKVEELVVA